MRTIVPQLLLLFVVPMLAACASVPSPALDGREFLSTAVSENGAAKALVPGTQIRIGFDEGGLHASAGCNSMGGGYTLVEGGLVVEPLWMTEMACDGPRGQQDEWAGPVPRLTPPVRVDGQ